MHIKTILLLSILTFAAANAQLPDSSSALFQMRETEQNFARASVMHGRNSAFIEYFAEESVIFSDHWLTNGRQFWKELKERPVELKWEPEFMDISNSLDFGVSTGPWEVQEYRPYTAALATGYFLTVWKKQSDNKWKVILDAGSETPKMKEYIHSFSFPKGADKSISDQKYIASDVPLKEMKQTEVKLLDAWKTKPGQATYSTFLAPNARIQRNGFLPATTGDSINLRLTLLPLGLKWTLSGAAVASSGDLGYTYGLIEISGSQNPTGGHYIRIWKKQEDGLWKILIEMLSIN
jgi:ketosteroid isomerase-like protein